MQLGWIKLNRGILDNEIWTFETFTRGQAWVDLLLKANHTDGFLLIRGMQVEIKRGQIGWSELKLAKTWRWSRDKVRRFLKLLESKRMIIHQKNNVTSLISIINYDLYQSNDTPNDTPNDTTEKHQTIQQTDTRQDPNKNVKNNKNEKNEKNEKKQEVILPEWLPTEVWEKYRDHRRALKSRMTKNAEELAIAKLIKFRDYGHDPVEVINQSIENGWKGLFELKRNGSDNPHKGKISDATWATMKIGQEILKRDKEKEGQNNAGQNPFRLTTDPVDK